MLGAFIAEVARESDVATGPPPPPPVPPPAPQLMETAPSRQANPNAPAVRYSCDLRASVKRNRPASPAERIKTFQPFDDGKECSNGGVDVTVLLPEGGRTEIVSVAFAGLELPSITVGGEKLHVEPGISLK